MTAPGAAGGAATPTRWSAEEIRNALADQIERLTTELVGEEPTCRARGRLRYYARGGLVITTSGPARGVWCSHGEGGIGGDPLDLIAHFQKYDVAGAFAWARRWLGHAPRDNRPSHSLPAPPPGDRDTTDLARRLWREAVRAAGTPAAAYLASRGLTLPAYAPIRFHPQCPRGAERLPAMLSLMTDPITNEPTGVHRTFLRADGAGKADGPSKMMAGRAGVIRLVPDEEVTLGLGIAEGIETSLAIIQNAEWSPVWACGSAGAIAKFPVLAGLDCITIFADMDDSGAGIAAAEACAARWVAAGREAVIERPPVGLDWRDALVPVGRAA